MGEMVTPAWEGYATQLANAEQEGLLTAMKDVIEREAISMAQEASVFVSKDTRPSSESLSHAVLDGVHALESHSKGVEMSAGERCCSYDGDADRIVYYYCDSAGRFHLLDGRQDCHPHQHIPQRTAYTGIHPRTRYTHL
ncbi:unnamed protein product [Oncorhynchus mykiss]|uniref:Uncharacterized protein n=1 Tax=Oncorhynchus mykiss TaxID=8022 RepID=A0A060XV20_ONCMY|nr:unnamed protein product [Oncorhynchus mykiss]